MTLNQLHKKIGKLIAENKNVGRYRVSVAKETFKHNCEEDGQTILDMSDIVIDSVTLGDEDGGIAVTKEGRERYVNLAIIVGGSYNTNPGPMQSHYS